MTKKPKEETLSEITESSTVLMLRFEDLTITKDQNDFVIINKVKGGISDSAYAMTAVGVQKNWQLLDEAQTEIESGSQHGNRPFHFEGNLLPGLYTIRTGMPVKDFSKHRIPGRGYSITFRL